MPELKPGGLKAGTECWAWQYDWPPGLSRPMSAQKPVRGILAERTDRIGDTSRSPDWFVPYSGKSRRPAFTKAVRIEAMRLDSDRSAAEDAYNAAVKAVAARLLSLADMAQRDLLPLESDGFDASGGQADYSVMRPDLTRDYAGIAAAARPELALRDDHEGDLYSWTEFEALERRGCINRYDGSADLLLDGKGCSNALIDMSRGWIYIPDQYAVPFHLVREVFEGRSPQVLWFNK